ncbi:helix-turn-helix transcriptional regulator [Symbioplanes lichenis]|uniref:helix-turn-helix transcriptional regulator n=1 Tax=Symbioplanes lichenis TaxID=1629072 RepID=UPI0027381B58|nr:helix-turn-helix transcriptional regulator [Actinoplanes lichenis]
MEFGQAVRRWRDRVRPEAAGLPAGGQRRAAGLRREELAMLAGISVDYVTRLEQGRATGPSVQVVEALARALRLDSAEREHLFRLAGLVAPGRGTIPAHITPGVQRLLDRLDSTPVAVYDAAWTLITANSPWAALMGDFSGTRGKERNVVWTHFFQPSGRVEPLPSFEASTVADLRAAAARYPGDTRLAELIAELRAGSPRFRELWEEGAIIPHASERKTVHHPQVGALELDCDVLTVPGSDLRIVAYTAEPGSSACDRLALLSVVGQQNLVG